MVDTQLFGAVPSTWAEDAPVIDLSRDGQSAPHPHFARHVTTEVGPGAGKQMVHGHTRAGKVIPPHFRGKPQLAPPTNAEPAELYEGKA